MVSDYNLEQHFVSINYMCVSVITITCLHSFTILGPGVQSDSWHVLLQ